MWYLVLSRGLRNEEERKERTQPHLDWLAELHRSGQALFSGRTADGSYGIYVLLADSFDDGRALAAQDPYHIHGDRSMEVLEWNPQRAFRLDRTIADVEAMARGGSGGKDATAD
jgi:uncharacterized protein YciI